MLLFYPVVGKQRSHNPVTLYASLQIISDLMFFRGTHKKEFDSRWKSFTLVKKSMENRVIWKSTGCWLLSVSMCHLSVDLSNSPFLLQLHGKKQHIRALLIDRVLLQHEVGLPTHTHTHFVQGYRCSCSYMRIKSNIFCYSQSDVLYFCVTRWGSWWLRAVNIKWFIRSCCAICCCFLPVHTARWNWYITHSFIHLF